MSASCNPFSPLRNEIQGFIRSCEMILSSSAFVGNSPLSQEERKIVQYYSEELNAYLLASQIH
jgi:hypothetical protein